MSVLSYKDIQNFAKTINTTNLPKKNAYSMTGTVTELQSADAYKGDDEHTETLKLAKVQIDGGAECRASYDSVEVQVGDRVVVSIEDGKATITENYTNPNGNLIWITEATLPPAADAYGTFVETGQTGRYRLELSNVVEGNDTAEIAIPSGYKIIGIKDVTLLLSIKSQGNVWSEYNPIGGQWAAFIHLSSWTFTGETITICFGSDQYLVSQSSDYRFRAKVTCVCVKADELQNS